MRIYALKNIQECVKNSANDFNIRDQLESLFADGKEIVILNRSTDEDLIRIIE